MIYEPSAESGGLCGILPVMQFFEFKFQANQDEFGHALNCTGAISNLEDFVRKCFEGQECHG